MQQPLTIHTEEQVSVSVASPLQSFASEPVLVLAAEKYLREVWPAVTKALKEHCIACELNLVRDTPCSACRSRHSWC